MQFKVLHPEADSFSTYSLQQLEQAMQFTYLPRLKFKDALIRKKVVKRCLKAHKKQWFSIRQKWLGVLFAREIETGFCFPHLALKWFDASIGYGVVAERDIFPSNYIGEYTGILRKCHRRTDRENDYCFSYFIGEGKDSPFLVDAKEGGNLTRFINHSTKPNLEPISVFSGEAVHILLVAVKHIQKGEQLTYDYGEEYWMKREKAHLIPLF